MSAVRQVEDRPAKTWSTRRVITPEIRTRMLALRTEGRSTTEIAILTGFTRNAVQKELAALRRGGVAVAGSAVHGRPAHKRQQVVALWHQGLDVPAIAAAAQITRSAVRAYLRLLALAGGTPGPAGRGPARPKDRLEQQAAAINQRWAALGLAANARVVNGQVVSDVARLVRGGR